MNNRCARVPLHTIKVLLAALLLVFPPLLPGAMGQAIPGAGSILQQVLPLRPALPSSVATGLMIAPDAGSKLPSSAPFPVQSIQISGNTLFETATLHALVVDGEGRSLTLSGLDELVARITVFYRNRGYLLARAIIPAQTIEDGVVRVQVLEAHYGQIHLDNRSRVRDGLLQQSLAPLQGGQAIRQHELDHALLLLSDIPGVASSAILKPGEAVGSADLLVTAAPAALFSGNAVFDNDGNRYTGRARLGATFNVIGPLHQGDVLSISGLSSDAMNYARLSYDALLNGAGTRVGAAYSALHYSLGGVLAALDANGTARVSSLWLRQPLMRSRNVNLYGQIQHERLQLRDHIDASALRIDRHLDNWSASLSGDARDALLSGSSSWNLGGTTGRAGFDDDAALLVDAATARTAGRFVKWTANLAHVHSLAAGTTLYGVLAAQWANGNLDSSGKMVLGGPTTVRAYDIGALAGDAGYFASIELRRDLNVIPDMAWSGQWQAIAFIEHGHATINRTTWAAGANSASLSGAGIGLNWAGASLWNGRLSFAAPIGLTLAGTPGSARAWLEIGKNF